jgi:hypothetical protein
MIPRASSHALLLYKKLKLCACIQAGVFSSSYIFNISVAIRYEIRIKSSLALVDHTFQDFHIRRPQKNFAHDIYYRERCRLRINLGICGSYSPVTPL